MCQNVCPINGRKAHYESFVSGTVTQSGAVPYPNLIDTLLLTEEAFQEKYVSTALERTGWESIVRNAAIALGNVGDTSAQPYLHKRLLSTNNPVVIETATWAIHYIDERNAKANLPLVH
jgi:epoxyqueuosine reductase QueG